MIKEILKINASMEDKTTRIVGVELGWELCLVADLSFWDWVAVATLSFKSVAVTDFSLVLAPRCRP